MLVAVGVQNLAFEGFEIFGAHAACDGGFEAEETQDGGDWGVAGDHFFNVVVLVGGVGAGGEVLLDFEVFVEEVGGGCFSSCLLLD